VRPGDRLGRVVAEVPTLRRRIGKGKRNEIRVGGRTWGFCAYLGGGLEEKRGVITQIVSNLGSIQREGVLIQAEAWDLGSERVEVRP
jgi:hypothetical protein